MRGRIAALCLLLGLCIGFNAMAEETPYFFVPDTCQIPVLTPALSARETAKLRLANGLEVYVVSDPDSAQAGAVLTVAAGSWDDPESYPGLAHFLEHLLFLGTEKYPLESDYDRFIQAHHGETNAYTTTDYTLYLFSVNAAALEEALDRFSFFFKKPLFNPSGVSRERHAVDQEFVKNLDNAQFREGAILKELARPDHPFHRFSAGNADTLSAVTQEILQAWYHQHYSADKMRLIVYGAQPLDTLICWITEDFQAVPKHSSPPADYSSPLFSSALSGKLVQIQSTRAGQTLQLNWDIPITSAQPTTFNPAAFITTLLNDDGPGSLLALLQAENLAESLQVGGTRLSRDHLLFSMDIGLTTKGAAEVSTVVQRVFQAIAWLQAETFPAYLFEEAKKISLARYQYQSRQSIYHTLMYWGELLVYEQLDRFPEGALVPQAFDAAAVQQFLAYLTPQGMLAALSAGVSNVAGDRQERWTGTRYRVTDLPVADARPDSHFSLPGPNPFMPSEISRAFSGDVLEGLAAHPLPPPQLIIDNEQAQVYFARDDYFGVPQTLWFFEIRTPAIDGGGPMPLALTALYVTWLREQMQDHRYAAQTAGLSYDISATSNGLLLKLSGYPEGVQKLFKAVLAKLKAPFPSPEEFERLKSAVLAHYRQSGSASAIQQALSVYRSVLYDPFVSSRDELNALEEISYERFMRYWQHLYDDTYVQALLYGAISTEAAQEAYRCLEAVLASRPFPCWQHQSERVIVLPAEGGPYLVEVSIPAHAHAAVLAIEGDDFSFKVRAAQEILVQALRSAFYSTLRTKQQTGYLLFVREEEIDQHLFMLFAVQSATHDPRDLLARFELFMEGFLQEMERSELTKADFERIRQSLLQSLEHYPQNLPQTGRLMHHLVFQREGKLDQIAQRIQGFQELTYPEFIQIAQAWLGKQNKRRLAILARGVNQGDLHYQQLPDAQAVRAVSQYT